MKRTVFSLFLLSMSVFAFATDEQNDTIPVNYMEITQVVTDVTTNKKGRQLTKYYFIYKGELVATSTRVVEMYNLSKKHGVKLKLSMIVNQSTGRKRITY